MSLKTRNKITPKVMGFGVKQAEDIAASLSDGEEKAVAHIAGVIYEQPKVESSTYGEYKRYAGNFKAINLITEDQYQAKHLILPSLGEIVVDEMIGDALDSDGGSVEVLLALTITKNDSDKPNASKYIWGVEPLIENTNESPLDKLLAKAPTPALEAPKNKKK